MTEYNKYNIVYRLQKWMDSVPGQTFLNYAYSWGASIVILGTLFKLTHLPGANVMLFIGMGTEVCVFFISAFDRPFDKTADGRDIPTHITEEYLETGEVEYDEKGNPKEQRIATSVGSNVGGGTVIIGGGMGTPSYANPAAVASNEGQAPREQQASSEENPSMQTPQPNAGPNAGPVAWVAQQQNVTPEMAEAQSDYVEELKKLTEMLGKVSDQSERLTRDSEEMENLNRTLTGICKVYEMQLKGASQQIGTIDQINDQSRKMAQQIEQLNKIYTRMIEAMTVNMRAATPNAAPKTEL